jgi:hypothetical protein
MSLITAPDNKPKPLNSVSDSTSNRKTQHGYLYDGTQNAFFYALVCKKNMTTRQYIYDILCRQNGIFYPASQMSS